eukprot:SAG22_NODE_18242_length_290_cov_1.298429_1_plen_42_part_10
MSFFFGNESTLIFMTGITQQPDSPHFHSQTTVAVSRQAVAEV